VADGGDENFVGSVAVESEIRAVAKGNDQFASARTVPECRSAHLRKELEKPYPFDNRVDSAIAALRLLSARKA
jgi:hypothetical protein